MYNNLFSDEEEDNRIHGSKLEGFLTQLKFSVDEMLSFNKNNEGDYPQKSLEYFSTNISIIRYELKDVILFLVEDEKGNIRHISYVRDEKLISSHIMNLINRGEQR